MVSSLFPAPPALAEVTPGLEIDAAGAFSSNPLLVNEPDPEAAVADIAIRPSLELSSDTGSSVKLGGTLSAREYSRLYDGFFYGNAYLSGRWRNDERLTVLAGARFDRDPLIDRLASDIDASINSQGVRESWSGEISAIWQPNAYTRVQPVLRTETGRYPGTAILNETRVTTAAVSATWRRSPRTTLGVRMRHAGNSVEAAPDSSVVAGYVILQQQLDNAWRLSAELGAEHSRSRRAPRSPIETRTQAAGQIEICRQTSRSRLCASAALASEVSGLGSLQRRFALSTSAQWRLTERLDLVFQADYQRASPQESNLPQHDAAQAFLRLDRRLGKTLTLSAIAEYRYREPLLGGAISAGMFGLELKYVLPR